MNSLIPLMMAIGRMHGIGPDATVPTWIVAIGKSFRLVSTIVIGLVAALGDYSMYGLYDTGFSAPLAMGAVATGHGNFYTMQGVNPAKDVPEQIEIYGGRWLWTKCGFSIYTPAYSWWCMGIKGMLYGLSIFPFGLPLAIIFPAAYAASWKFFNTSAVAEYVSVGSFGLAVSCILYLLT